MKTLKVIELRKQIEIYLNINSIQFQKIATTLNILALGSWYSETFQNESA